MKKNISLSDISHYHYSIYSNTKLSTKIGQKGVNVRYVMAQMEKSDYSIFHSLKHFYKREREGLLG